jgi:hypothetical protein
LKKEKTRFGVFDEARKTAEQRAAELRRGVE